MILAGNLAQGVTGLDFVVNPLAGGAAGGGDGTAVNGFTAILHLGGEQDVGLIAVDGILHVQEGRCIVERQSQYLVRTGTRDNVRVVLGIEVPHVV